MLSCRHLIPTALSFTLFAACPGGESTGEDGPIAPNCGESICAEVEVSAKMSCHDEIEDQDFTLSAGISGKTMEVTCAGDENPGGGMDLSVGITPDPKSENDASEFWFRIRDYTGPGTYPLKNLGDDGDNIGVKLIGNASRDEKVETVGTNACVPSPCEAVVAEGSESIPNDPSTVHDFRVRVEVRCPAGGKLTDMHCMTGEVTSCTFDQAPTLKFDLLCRN